MTDVVERMARAAWTVNMDRCKDIVGFEPLSWENETEALRDDWRAFMRAALAAQGELP